MGIWQAALGRGLATHVEEIHVVLSLCHDVCLRLEHFRCSFLSYCSFWLVRRDMDCFVLAQARLLAIEDFIDLLHSF